MKQLNGYEKAKIVISAPSALPKGGYIAKIESCEEVHGEKNGKQYNYLAFYFDIAEGEHKGHFAELYKTAPLETRKWRGFYNYFLPDEGSEYYEQNLNRFKTVVANFEESNPGFHFDWDETKFKGKMIGILFREKEFITNDGETKVTTEPCGFRSVEMIKSGNYRIPMKRALPNSSTQAPAISTETFMPVEEAKLPWD